MLYTKRKGVFMSTSPQSRIRKDGDERREDYPFRQTCHYRFRKIQRGSGRRCHAQRTAGAQEKGINTIWPNAPQPYWFYNLCDELGLFVIDQANINAPEKRDDRTTGGTPSNDPRLADEYLERVRNMYYRSRNHTCIIGFALGGESGNGYNMYKAYQWLKSVEPSRPVICIDADGEWNTDLEIVP